jgi:hypothetical protein
MGDGMIPKETATNLKAVGPFGFVRCCVLEMRYGRCEKKKEKKQEMEEVTLEAQEDLQ